MKPSSGRFQAGGYADYSALQKDAARRLERMEQRARQAVGGNADMPAGTSPGDTAAADDNTAGTAGACQAPASVPAPAACRQNAVRLDAAADRWEQLFLLLLIYILSREKGDPGLIAALVYLMI